MRALIARITSLLRPGAFVRAVGVLVLGTVVGQVATIAASPILSRLFDPASFGVFALYVAVLGVATTVASLRLEQAIGLPRSKQVAFNILVLSVLCAVGSAFLIGVLALLAPQFLFPDRSAEIPALVAALLPFGVLFGAVYQAISIWALRTRAFGPVSFTRASQGIGTALAQIVAGLLALGAVGLTAGHALGQSIGAGTLIGKTLRGSGVQRPRLRELWYGLKRYRRFPLLALPAALLNSVSVQVPTIALAAAFGAAATGQYFLSVRITMAPLDLIARSIGQVFYADAIALGRRRPRALRSLVVGTSVKSFLIGLMPGLLALILSPVLFPIIFGPDWLDAGLMSQSLAIMLMANFAVTPITQIFLIVEMQVFSVIVNAIKMATALFSVLVPVSLGATAVSVVGVYSLAMAAYYFFVLAVVLVMLTVMGRTKGVQAN